MCCAVRRGTVPAPALCSPLIASAARPVLAAMAFVVLWLGSLRGKAGVFPFALLLFYLLIPSGDLIWQITGEPSHLGVDPGGNVQLFGTNLTRHGLRP